MARPARSRLEDLIAWVSPSWAATRAAHRFRLQEVERLSYRAARHTRVDRRAPGGGTADYHLEEARDRESMIDRGRQLERDSVVADWLLTSNVDNVVGCGPQLRAGSSSDAWNERAQALWHDWAEEAADVRGLSSFGELVGLIQRSKVRDGDVGTALLADGALQMIEADQIVSPVGRHSDPRMVDGVELDRRGRPIAFHVVEDPDLLLSQTPHALAGRVSIPAEFFLFEARRKRAGQTRGVPGFSNTAWLFDQLDGNIEAVTTAARMAACVGMILQTDVPMQGLQEKQDADGNRYRSLKLRPGGLVVVGKEEKATPVTPQQPGQDFAEFLRTLCRFAGLGFGVPLELAFLDFSRTTYSSARAALLQAWQTWLCHQRGIKRFCTKVYRWKLIRWMEEGRLRPRSDALVHRWIMPGWRWVDPEKELSAALGAVDAGLDSLTGVAAGMGRELVEVLEERKKELDLMAERNIPVVRSRITRDPGAPPAQPEPDEDQDDEGQERPEEER